MLKFAFSFFIISIALALILVFPGLYAAIPDNYTFIQLKKSPESVYASNANRNFDNNNITRVDGHFRLNSSDTDLALDLLQHATTGSQASLAFFDLCRILWQEGRYSEAHSACSSGAIPPDYWLNKGLDFQKNGALIQAIKAFWMAVILDPDGKLRGQELLAYTAIEVHEPNTIIKMMEPWIFQFPDSSPQVYRLVGKAYWDLGLPERAMEILQIGNQHFPESPDIHLLLAYIHEGEFSDIGSAAYWYDQYLIFRPEHTYALLQRAAIAEKQDDWILAFELYQKASKTAPDDIKPLLGGARAMVSLGNKDAAVELLNQALVLDPANEYTREQIESLTSVP